MKLESLSALGAAGETATVVHSAPGAELVERGDIGAVQLVAVDEEDGTVAALERSLAKRLPPVGVAGDDVIGFAPRKWLVFCRPEAERDLVERVSADFPAREVLAVRFGDALAWYEIVGDGAETALRKGAFLRPDGGRMGVGSVRRLLLAGIPAIVLRQAEDRWRIGIERSRAGAFATWFVLAEANEGGRARR